MRKYIKRFSSLLLIPLTRWYLRKERTYTYQNTTVKIKPGVFHPGLFHSTKFLLEYLAEQNLTGKRLLELGCGTGLISVIAAKSGASVIASDLSKAAVQNARNNAELNQVNVNVRHSDLFNEVPETFDFIIINPPYYARDVIDETSLAWNCGRNFEYFYKLFAQLPTHINPSTQIIMVLTKGCDIQSISTIANVGGFTFKLVKDKNVLFDEKDYIYLIRANSFL